MCLLCSPFLTPENKCAMSVIFNLETEEEDDVGVFWKIRNETHAYFKKIKWEREYASMCTSVPLGEGSFYSFEKFKSCSMWTDHWREPKISIVFCQQDAKDFYFNWLIFQDGPLFWGG